MMAESGHKIADRKLSHSIFGIVFLGTPQQESSTDFGLLGGIAAFTQALTMSAQDQSETGTRSLTNLNREFLAYVRRRKGGRAIRILSCFEENETEFVGSIVPEAIAMIPNGSKMSLPGDHLRMVKFGSKEDLGFLKISSFLKTWTTALHISQSSLANKIESDTSYSVEFANRSRCLNSLAIYSQGQRRSQIECETAGTSEWILRNSDYQKWMDFDHNSAGNSHLWIERIPGSGKSTLMQFLVRRLEAQPVFNIVPLAVFFKFRGHKFERSVLSLYGCLLYQLLQMVPNAGADFYRRLLEKEETRGRYADWNREELSEAFEMVLNSCPPKHSRLVFFIDGLDGCEDLEGGRRIVEHFIRLRDRLELNGSILKVCWSTRLISAYIGFNAVLHIQMEHEIQADIERFINRGVDKARWSIESQQELVKESKEPFRWAYLAIQRIAKERERSPTSIANLYESVWAVLDTSTRRKVDEIIQWLTFAFQPLKIEELGLGLSFKSEIPPSSLKAVTTAERFAANRPHQLEKFVTDTLGHFIHTTEEDGNRPATLQFSDLAVKEFLWKRSSLHLFGIETDEDAIAKAHLKLARACCNYVRVNEITQNIPAVSSDAATWIKRLVDAKPQNQNILASFQWTSFTNYVVRYLFQHARRSSISFEGRTGILQSEKVGFETKSLIAGLLMLYCTIFLKFRIDR